MIRLRASVNRAPLSGRASELTRSFVGERVRKRGDCQRDCASNHQIKVGQLLEYEGDQQVDPIGNNVAVAKVDRLLLNPG